MKNRFNARRISNKLKVDRWAIARYPSRVAHRTSSVYLTEMKNGRIVNVPDGMWAARVDFSGQLDWILANRLPDPHNVAR